MTTSRDTELIRRLEHALALLECATSGGPPDLIPRPSTLLAEARARLAQPEPKFAFTNLAARPLLEKVAHMADCIGQRTVAEIAAISSQAAAWLRENPPGQPVAIEPRGCPTPGACSCVEPAALAQPEPEGVTARELQWPPSVAQGCHEAAAEAEPGSPMQQLLVAAGDLLENYAHPTIKPVPVAERPWERDGWCDDKGECYAWDGNYWWKVGGRWWERHSEPDEPFTHSLPHYAMPIPATH